MFPVIAVLSKASLRLTADIHVLFLHGSRSGDVAAGVPKPSTRQKYSPSDPHYGSHKFNMLAESSEQCIWLWGAKKCQLRRPALHVHS